MCSNLYLILTENIVRIQNHLAVEKPINKFIYTNSLSEKIP